MTPFWPMQLSALMGKTLIHTSLISKKKKPQTKKDVTVIGFPFLSISLRQSFRTEILNFLPDAFEYLNVNRVPTIT